MTLICGSAYLRKISSVHYLVLLYASLHGITGLLNALGATVRICALWFVALQGFMVSFEIAQLCIGIMVLMVTLSRRIRYMQKKILTIFTIIIFLIPIVVIISIISTNTLNIDPTASTANP